MNLRGLFAAEFYGVADEVLEQLGKLHVVEINSRQIVGSNFCARFLYTCLKTRNRLVEGRFGIDLLGFLPCVPTREYSSRPLISDCIRLAPSMVKSIYSVVFASRDFSRFRLNSSTKPETARSGSCKSWLAT